MFKKNIILTVLFIITSTYAYSITVGTYQIYEYSFKGDLLGEEESPFILGYNPDIELYFLSEDGDIDDTIFILKEEIITKAGYSEFLDKENDLIFKLYDNYIIFYDPEDLSWYAKAELMEE